MSTPLLAESQVARIRGMPAFSRGTPAGLWRNKVDNRTFNHELIRDVTGAADA
jgi:hypothetical protein